MTTPLLIVTWNFTHVITTNLVSQPQNVKVQKELEYEIH